MYYNWSGDFSVYGYWSGIENYSFLSGNTFNVFESISVLGMQLNETYDVNNQTRITDGGLFGGGTSTPYWIFTNISVSSYVPIAVDGGGDALFQVIDIETHILNSKSYTCFYLNNGNSWAYYDTITGILIDSYFAYGSGNYYTINLNVTNAAVAPISLSSPTHKTYRYSDVPIVAHPFSQNIQQVWFRDSADGGADWSQNTTLIYNGTDYVNGSTLAWADGSYLLQVFSIDALGTVWMVSVSFTVNTYGPWIEILSPSNTTYYKYNLTLGVAVVVDNYTYADSAWWRFNSGGSWSDNNTLLWDGNEFIANAEFFSGIICLQVFANDSQNHIANEDVWFSFVQCTSPMNYTMTPYSPYSWIDATLGSRSNLAGLDDASGLYNLPFGFPFYNASYNAIYVCTNGFASFGNYNQWNNVPFPTSYYPNFIAPFWSDLKAANPCNIFVENLTSPNRVAIEWQNVTTSAGVLVGSFEIVLNQSGSILYNYQNLSYAPRYTCGLNLGLDTRFFNQYVGLNSSTINFSILFTYPQNLFVPNLVGLAATPPTGNQSTLYTFNATYSDQDNNPPAFLNVDINGSPFGMQQINATDTDYVDGCNFSVAVYLQPGTYSYYYDASDGSFEKLTSTLLTLTVSRTNFYAPSLTRGQINSLTGYASITNFQFMVNYSDPDNNAPAFVNLVVDSTSYPMSPQVPSTTNFMAGSWYDYTMQLGVGLHSFYFICSDGDFYNSTDVQTGPTVVLIDNPPQLTNGRVSAQSGTNATTFRFTVTYSNPDNDPPVGYIHVYIDDIGYAMIAVNPLNCNYVGGVDYYFTTTLANGNHTFYFSAFDGNFTVTTGSISGPVVLNSNGTSIMPPTSQSVPLSVIITIGIAEIGVIAVSIFFIGHSRKIIRIKQISSEGTR